MAQYYSSIKSMKSARIGTIMPWSGTGTEGFTVSNLPKGWIVCDGQFKDAADYPLLASEIGATYGEDAFTGQFPNYSGRFKLPDIKNKGLIDLEKGYLGSAEYQHGQSDAISVLNTYNLLGDGSGDDIANDYGPDAPNLSYNATADIDFSFPDNTIKLSGKLTGQSISEPTFFTTISTIPRKLGLNHMPSHNHTAEGFQTATATAWSPEVFYAPSVQLGGRQDAQVCEVKAVNIECTIIPGGAVNAPSWRNGRTWQSWHGDMEGEQTIPPMDQFYDYQNDTGKDYWSAVPAPSWHDGTSTRNSPKRASQTAVFSPNAKTDQFAYSPCDNDPTNSQTATHYHPAWQGLHPRPRKDSNRVNYFIQQGDTTYNQLDDHPEDPSLWFTVANIPTTQGSDIIVLPAGTDIRTTITEGTAPNIITSYKYDKIRPYKLVDGPGFEKGTMIETIEQSGTDDTNYSYEIKLSKECIETTTGEDVVFRDGTWPTTINTFAPQNPDDNGFTSHQHGTFDLQMSTGSLKPQSTYIVSDVSLGNVSPINEDNALNIVTTITQPSMTIVYLIKAY